MAKTDEKKPPVGGVVDYQMLRTHCRVQDHLLEARQRLESAAFACYTGGLRPCGDEINRFVEQDLDALFRRVVECLESGEAILVRPVDGAGSPTDRSPSPQSPG